MKYNIFSALQQMENEADAKLKAAHDFSEGEIAKARDEVKQMEVIAKKQSDVLKSTFIKDWNIEKENMQKAASSKLMASRDKIFEEAEVRLDSAVNMVVEECLSNGRC